MPADDAERGARVDAEQSGLGQRVAGDRLEQAPGDAEGGTDEQCGEGAREAQVADDEGEPGVVARAVPAQQVVEDAAGADLARADREGEGRQQQDGEGQSGGGRHHGPPSRVGRGAGIPGLGVGLSGFRGCPGFGSRECSLVSGGYGLRRPVGFAPAQLNGRGVMFGSRGRGPRARRLHKVRLA